MADIQQQVIETQKERINMLLEMIKEQRTLITEKQGTIQALEEENADLKRQLGYI